jgi:ABC-type transport system involved in multi-copper enzyme maturation permease subunit
MRDTRKPLPFARAARAVFDLSLEGMVWSRRTLLMGTLVALPVVVAVAYRVVLATRPAARLLPPADLYAVVVAVYWLRNVLPLTALFFATALVADEVEGKTLTYLTTRPLTRPAVFAGKFAAYVVTALTLALPAGVLTFFVLLSARGGSALAGAAPDLLRDLGVMALALVAYGALFALLGVLLKRPVVPGLAFLYGWELMANLPGFLPRFTFTAWLRSLVRHRPAEEGLAGLFQQVLPAGTGLLVLVGASVAFLAAASWIFSTREYVLEQ